MSAAQSPAQTTPQDQPASPAATGGKTTPASLRTLAFWVLVALALGSFLHLVEGILLPFVLGALIAYLLNPLIEPLEGMGAPRWICALGILVLFFTAVTAILAILTPIVYQEVEELIRNIPHYVAIARDWAQPYIDRLNPYIGGLSSEDLSGKLQENAGQAASVSKHILDGVVATTQAMAGFASTLVLTPIVAFYMMTDWPAITGTVKGLIPRRFEATILGLVYQMDRTLAGFIRGQVSVCVTLGLLYGLALLLMGLKFGFVIGLASGVLSFIPFIGSAFGLVASVTVAWFQFGTAEMVGIALGIFVVGQMLEGNVLTPRMIGGSVQLHPLWIIFALMAGGAMLGFTGMLIALPAAAMIGVLVRFFVARYKDSAMYLDTEGAAPAPQVKAAKTAPKKRKTKAARSKASPQ